MPRSQSVSERAKHYVKSGTAEFFGLKNDVDPLAKYHQRRLRLTQKQCGNLKAECYSEPGSSTHLPPVRDIRDPLARPAGMGRLESVDSAASGRRSLYNVPSSGGSSIKKESVAKMTIGGMATLLKATMKMRRTSEKKQPTYVQSRSYAPASVTEDLMDSFPVTPSLTATPATADVFDSSSFMDDVFFDVATPSPTVAHVTRLPQPRFPVLSHLTEENLASTSAAPLRRTPEPLYPDLKEVEYRPEPVWKEIVTEEVDSREPRPRRIGTWQRRTPEASAVPTAKEADVGYRRIWDKILDRALDNSERRRLGIGALGDCLNRRWRRDRIDSDVKKQLDDISDHRPYFTYWVTIVQIIICIVSITVFGLAPIGYGQTEKESLVLKPSLAMEPVGYLEPDNLWIGPTSASLIHLGAKYSPCMRKDKPTWDIIYAERRAENNSACCIRNDGGGCIQTVKDNCNEFFSKWHKWDGTHDTNSPDTRTKGSVCGQDPRECGSPASTGASVWPDDLTRWPICKDLVTHPEETGYKSGLEHMTCDLIGRPCCIGIRGECIFTTREYCDFVNGYFHEEANLCSQVSCMDEVCGMISFYNPHTPDQFYRLFTSLFLHAGIVHCLLTVILQMFLMRDLEKLAGPVRIAAIYLLSGIAGNLASAIFLPKRAEVGPAGSQLGLLGMLFVEVFQSWQLLAKPWIAILKLTGILIFLFILGLFPWVDNYAHVFGFIFGLFLSFGLLPYVTFGEFDQKRKLVTVVTSLLLAFGLFITLVILFYVTPIYDCSWCTYFNCIPWSSSFCNNYEIKIFKD